MAIDVAAAGVNFADCVVRMGLYESAKKYVGYPITPGFEVAGTVAACGPGVDRFEEGTPVLAVTRFGGYATRIVVPVGQVFERGSWDPVEAAAFPTVHLTAWYALVELARPRQGAKVLVHSGAGGVGGALIQLARQLECEVVGVVGASHKVPVCETLGAHAVIDKSRQDLWREARRLAPDGFDVVLDANGVETLQKSYEHLTPGGRLVVYGFHSMLAKGRGRPRWSKLARDWLRTPRFNPMRLTADNRGILGFNLSYMFQQQTLLAEGMAELLTARDAGALRPLPCTPYAFDRVADAHRALESGSTVGKLVLVP